MLLGVAACSTPAREGGEVSAIPAPARLEVALRDSMTGLALVGRVTAIELGGRVASSLTADPSGRAPGPLPPGQYRVKAEAIHHRTLETAFDLEAGATLGVTLWLDPEEVPEALRPEPLATLGPETAVFHGYVVDGQSGQPLSDASVSLERSDQRTKTDRGYFRLSVAAPRPPDLEPPPMDLLTVQRDGYRTFRSGQVFVTGGVTRFLIRLWPGLGRSEEAEGHKMLREARTLSLAQSAVPDAPEPRLIALAASPPSSGVPVPASIRVGFDCQCASCRTVQVFSLETYVKQGLDDEWIASWHDQSLRAGAIAYRSYAVYRVFHPLRANYDICSTTCCQVQDPTTSHARTDAAVEATAGTIVVNGQRDQPFVAEYGAENNGRYCPDGSTGRPELGWPCLGDAVDATHAFNGHGRGMCQWGTQRWAVGQHKNYCWIVDHYFNDNGKPSGARAGVIQVPGGRPCSPR